MLRAVELNNEGQDDETVDYSEQVELSSELAKFTQIRSLSITSSIAPDLLCKHAFSQLKALSLLEFHDVTVTDANAATILHSAPLLTIFKMLGISGLTGIWWLRHARLERFTLATKNTKLSACERDGATAHTVIDSERVPKLTDLSLTFREVQLSLYVGGHQRLKRLTVEPVRTAVVENNIELRARKTRCLLLSSRCANRQLLLTL